MLEITTAEKLVQQFLIDYTFANKTVEELYEIFKSFQSNDEVSFEEFKEAFNMLCLALAEFNAEMKYSSKSEIDLFRVTYAEMIRLKAFRENFKILKRVSNLETIGNFFLYDDIRSEALYDAFNNEEDYTLKLVSVSETNDAETIVYHATRDELQEQLLEAAKLIENAGKRYI